MLLSPSDLDTIRNAAFVAAFLFNPVYGRFSIQAGAVLLFSLLGKAVFILSPTGFYACLAMAVLYSINSALDIRIKSEIRHALILVGCVNWLGAADYLAWPYSETCIFIAYPYMINLLDLFIIYHLFKPSHGGGKVANYNSHRFGWPVYPGCFACVWSSYRAAVLPHNFTFIRAAANLCKSKESKRAKANRT